MYLNVVPTKTCSLSNIRVPIRLRKSLNIDLGDWLVFETEIGPLSVMVNDTTLEDTVYYGDNCLYVSEDSIILKGHNNGTVSIHHHQMTLGADPEFFIIDKDTNRLIEAYKIFNHSEQVGSDGDLAEFRPDYTLGPEQLVENIRRLVRQTKERLPEKLFPLASSWHSRRCCGFHVHMGLPVELLSFAAKETDSFLKNIITTLDYFIGISSALLDDTDSRRLSREYGNPGDYRLSMRTIEYRTPGGFNLKNDKYAASLLSSSFSVIENIIAVTEEETEYWRKMDKVCKFDYFSDRYGIPTRKEILNILTSRDKKLMIKEAPSVFSKLETIMGDLKTTLVKEKINDTSLYEGWLY